MTTKSSKPGSEGSDNRQIGKKGSMARRSHHAFAPAAEAPEELTPRALTKQEFGRRLQMFLDERGWSQSDLHRETKEVDPEDKGVGRDAVSTYINGRSFPTPKSLNFVCKALGVKREELLPNALLQAVNDEQLAFEMRAAAGHPGKAWVKLNRMLSFDCAARIAQLINEEDKRDFGEG